MLRNSSAVSSTCEDSSTNTSLDIFVKLQSKLNSPVQAGKEQEQEQEEEEPSPKKINFYTTQEVEIWNVSLI